MPCGRMSIAWRSRSCDLRASAIAASASARLRVSSSVSTAAFCGFARVGDRSVTQVSAARFRFVVFPGLKLNFTRPTRARRPQVFGQVSERKVIMGLSAADRSAMQPVLVPVSEARRVKPAHRTNPVAARATRRGAKLGLSTNLFQGRARLYAACAEPRSRARILASAEYGYRDVNNRPLTLPQCRLELSPAKTP